jgi:peptidoglycan/LPS O-acetylase OafA/YrhL
MAATRSPTLRPTLPALTGVRFLAALAVVTHHFARPANPYLKAANEHGFIGVTLFFILSGFILTYTYFSEPGSMKGSARMFWSARFARIYPMYLVAMVLMAPLVLAWSTSGHAWQSGLAAFVLVQAWISVGFCEWNPPGWSLSAEAFFYLIFPLAIKALSACSRRRMIGLLVLFWAAALTAPIIYLVNGAVDRDFWMFNPLVRLPEFLMGMTVGVLWMERDDKQFVLPKLTAEISLAVLLAVLCIPMHEAYVMNGACAPLMLLIILGLANGEGLLARILSTKFLVVLGGASYSLYIIHWPVWYEARSVLEKLHVRLDPNSTFWLITLGVLIPASYICFRYIEEPVNKTLRKRFSSMLPQVPTTELGPPEATASQ